MSGLAAADHSPALPEIVALIDAGHFSQADTRIASALASDHLTGSERRAFEFERERMRRIALDFSLSEADAKARLRKNIPDLKDEEFARWDRAGLLERLSIDGTPRYFNRAPSNLYLLSPEAAARRATPYVPFDGPLEQPHPYHREIVSEARTRGLTSVAPRRVYITHSIVVEPDAVPAGETVRAWVPFPRAIAGHQEDIRLIESAPARHAIAPESDLQRTVYLEQAARAGEPTRFSITYELTIFAQYHALDAAHARPTPSSPALAEHLGERPPHIVFTPAMREFSRRVVGEEKNPYLVARRLFAAVDAIPWAGAREYSTLTNISDYALHAGHADCGQQTLLLITLLRLNGIPARWQSGMVFSDGEYDNLHDWGLLYLEPWGWVPMDVTFGFLRSGDAAVDDFYLGSLDGWRIAFNDDYGRPFTPRKTHFRSETVDLQRGEVEWRGGNLYFDRWDYEFEARLLPPSQAHAANE